MDIVNANSVDPAIDDTELDEPIPTEEVVTVNAFVGQIPYDVLMEGINNQFTDYIGLEDKTNYVEIFYKQWNESYSSAEDEYEEHPSEVKDYLDDLKEQFTLNMQSLFNTKLALSIPDNTEPEQMEIIIHTVYEGLVLNAKKNFMTAITKDVLSKINTQLPANYTDDQWYDTIRSMLEGYSPIVVEIDPDTFLRYIGNDDLFTMYQDGQITGNFLRKYSPRLFQNEEFEIELISNITLTKDVKEDLYASTTGEQPD